MKMNSKLGLFCHDEIAIILCMVKESQEDISMRMIIYIQAMTKKLLTLSNNSQDGNNN